MKKPKPVYYTMIKHFGHMRTLEKCRKDPPVARVFYISLVFSNACRVLSQCNKRLRLLYLLNTYTLLVPGLKNTTLIFPELISIECCAVIVEPPMMSSLSSFA